MLQTVSRFLSANPNVLRGLLIVAAALLHKVLGPVFDEQTAVAMLTGLLVGWGVLPRPGDTGLVHVDDLPNAVK
jgi:hypothetical protein